MKHNCYNCKYRGGVPGSVHSNCNVLPQNQFTVAIYVAQQNGQTEKLKLNPHGVRNGWAFWPLDFDPCWVDHCNFYEEIK